MAITRHIAGYLLPAFAVAMVFTATLYAQEKAPPAKPGLAKSPHADAAAKVMPAPPVQSASKADENDFAKAADSVYSWTSPIWTNWIQAGSAFFVMLMTFGLWRLGIQQTRILKRNAKDTADSVKIAKQSAEAALSAATGTQRLAEAAIAQVVPHISVTPSCLMRDHALEIKVRVLNSGQTPARSVEVRIALHTVGAVQGDNADYGAPSETIWFPEDILPKDQKEHAFALPPFTEEQMARFKSAACLLLATCTVQYVDCFDMTQTKTFERMRFKRPNDLLTSEGDFRPPPLGVAR